MAFLQALRFRLCFMDKAVPLQPVSLYYKDIQGLEGDGQKDFLKVDLRTHADIEWLLAGTDLRTSWWRQNSSKLPLVRELHEAIAESKKGIKRRAPRRPELAVFHTVRGKQIILNNRQGSLEILMVPGQEHQTIEWLLSEIRPEIANLQENPPAAPASSSQHQMVPAEPLEPDALAAKDVLAEFEDKVRKIQWNPSRCSFQVLANDGRKKEIFAKGLERKRKAARTHGDLQGPAWSSVRTTFAQCSADISAFLENSQGGVVPLTDA